MTRRHISSGSPWEALAGYSRAVVQRLDGADWIFVAGTLGVADLASGALAEGVTAQTHRALDIVERALAEVPATLADTVRVVAYVPERADVPAVAAVLKERLGDTRPANTTVCCPLVVAGARVELEITAVRRAAGAP